MNTFVFVEWESQISSVQRLLAEEPGATLVALTAHAERGLEALGLCPTTPEAFYAEEELAREGLANFGRLSRFCEEADGFLQAHIPVLAQTVLRPFAYHLFPLKLCLDGAMWRVFAIQRILAKERPDRVVSFDPGPERPVTDLLAYRGGSMWSRAISVACREQGVAQKILTQDKRSQRTWTGAKEDLPVRLSVRARLSSALRNLLRALGRGRYAALPVWLIVYPIGRLLLRWQDSRRPLVMAMDHDENLEAVIALSRRLGTLRIVRWAAMELCEREAPARERQRQRHLKKQLEELWPAFVAQCQHHPVFQVGDVSLWSMLESRLRHVCIDGTLASLRVHETTVRLLAYAPAAFIANDLSTPRNKAIADVALRRNVPVVTYVHGAFGWVDWPGFVVNDLQWSTHYFVYGEGMRDYCRWRCGERLQAIPVGSTELDALARRVEQCDVSKERVRLGLRPDRKVVVYCTTAVHLDLRHLLNTTPSDFYFRNRQRRILSALQGAPHVQVVFKLHPSRTIPTPAVAIELKARETAPCLISQSVPFNHFVPVADAFVLDIATTCLLEAMASDKPVFLLNDYLPLEPGIAEMLAKRCYLFDDVDELAASLRTFLSRSDWRNERHDGEFFRLFGLPSHDGQSAARAHEALRAIATGCDLQARAMVQAHTSLRQRQQGAAPHLVMDPGRAQVEEKKKGVSWSSSRLSRT